MRQNVQQRDMTLSSRREKSGGSYLPEVPFYSHKPVQIKIPKSWNLTREEQTQENLLDTQTIYARKQNHNSLPKPGHRDLLTRQASDIDLRQEQSYMRDTTGFPIIPHISGSACQRRRRPFLRNHTANNLISHEYRWVHNGLNGKMLLTNQRYRHALPPPMSIHQGNDSHLQYCEILGQRTCSQCVEEVNRHMAAEYQEEAFPGLEVTATSLVAPKLSKTLLSSQESPSKHAARPSQSKTSPGPFDGATTPPPYRLPSAFTKDRHQISISKERMFKSLGNTLRRDESMMRETGADCRKVPQLQRVKGHRSRLLPIWKENTFRYMYSIQSP